MLVMDAMKLPDPTIPLVQMREIPPRMDVQM